MQGLDGSGSIVKKTGWGKEKALHLEELVLWSHTDLCLKLAVTLSSPVTTNDHSVSQA